MSFSRLIFLGSLPFRSRKPPPFSSIRFCRHGSSAAVDTVTDADTPNTPLQYHHHPWPEWIFIRKDFYHKLQLAVKFKDLHKQEDQRPDLFFKCEIPYSVCHGGKDLWQSWLGVQHDSTHRVIDV
ncbi:hypothetical protein EZV62_023382 [Acer yangbiense]|uniref:Uncharacterized protein n=1 Tax=Acer yangbiense TaxID=1000413 RepID=A0A5C7H1K8_9ROSI|nr:hypothetical protein EZV62_023382 [Acer yangbiense]